MAYGYEAAGDTPTKPNMDELRLLDEVHDWCCQFLTPKIIKAAGLPRDAALLLWLRAEGVPWEQIQKIRRQMYAVPVSSRRGKKRRSGGRSLIPGGNSRTSLLGIYNRALEHVTAALNRSGTVVAPVVLPIETMEIPEVPRSMPQTVEDVLDQLALKSPLLQSALVAVVLAAKTPGGTQDLRRARQFIDREIDRRLAA